LILKLSSSDSLLLLPCDDIVDWASFNVLLHTGMSLF